MKTISHPLRSAVPSALALLVALHLAGCGGSGSSSPSTATPVATGQATLSITWPASTTRLIPVASSSVVVSFLSGSSVVSTQTVAKPTTGNTSTVTFTALPAGSLTLSAAAYPTGGGTGVAQASATQAVTITAGNTTAVALTLASTISTLSLSPAAPSVAVGGTTALTTTALDSSGATVLTSASTIAYVSSNAAVATVSSAGVVTGVAAGTATITVTESESGKSATTTATVTAASSSDVVTAANAFKAALTTPHQTSLQTATTYSSTNAKGWTNLPVGSRNGIMLGSLSASETSAAKTFLGVLLSTTGADELERIRNADEYIFEKSGGTMAWGYGKYYIAFIGTPGASPWSVQLSGHHYAYNFTFNGNTEPSVTPVFLGTEPPYFLDTIATSSDYNTTYGAVETQRAAIAALAADVQGGSSTVAAAAKLSQT